MQKRTEYLICDIADDLLQAFFHKKAKSMNYSTIYKARHRHIRDLNTVRDKSTFMPMILNKTCDT